MSLPSNSRSTLFLSLLRRHTLPLNELLTQAQSETWHLVGWLGNPSFVRKLKCTMRRRSQIHELSGSLTNFWAADKFTQRLQKLDEVSLEMLRKAAQPAKKTATDEPASSEPASFVHAGVLPADVTELAAVLSGSQRAEAAKPIKKAA